MRKEFERKRMQGIYNYKLSGGCVNCKEKAQHLHHIVPLSLGGTNNHTNIVALCEACHGKIHGITGMKLHSESIKLGMRNAKAQGKVIGRPETTLDDIPNSFLKHYPKLKNKELTKVEFAKLTGLSRPTIDKYIKIIKEKNDLIAINKE